ncbi:DUF5623 domain-containing protein [Mesorhizobium sp. L-2-11]|uniref:DUF5623 domain-containing protein n=1 Tax=Mesorhizobium sp. L-2-11 TaxID=2744521 RepID=UPI0019372FB7|nr:DUF5623 domain-containing protein [Mesorhizobium sp. L-2-11]BCH19918.1 hypothetical protein MesoLjLa_67690 [Mesorhizobium sp. L-2-11]
MSKTDVQPSSIEGIKRLAKAISKRDSIPHSKALDTASQVSGFGNFQHAHRSLGDRSAQASPAPNVVYISTFWEDGQTRTSGRETIRVFISKPLDELIKPSQYRYAHKLGRLRRRASDHVVDRYRSDSARAALDIACGAARVLQFMDITGLQPSKADVEPGAEYSARLPGRDHGSAWYDPVAKHHVGADEPYAGSAASKERDAWARRHNWSLARPEWAGMYYPGSCVLYLYADASKGYSLDGLLKALSKGPSPIVPANCDRVAIDGRAPFVTPGEKAKAEATLARNVQRKATAPRGPNTTAEYRLPLSGMRRRRPKAAMPVDAHARIGTLLKGVLTDMRARAGVYKRVDAVRSELDDWVQCEHDRAAMLDAVFFDLYYGENSAGGTSKAGDQHIEDLRLAQSILMQHYPDCAPLRDLVAKIDLAVISLEKLR